MVHGRCRPCLRDERAEENPRKDRAEPVATAALHRSCTIPHRVFAISTTNSCYGGPMRKILIVDDDGHIREVVRFALEQAGYQVAEARDGEEAWRLFQAGGIDLVLLDVVMPEADGLEVCRRIRQRSQ